MYYNESNIPSKELMKDLKKIAKTLDLPEAFGNRIIKRMRKAGVHITSAYTLAALLLDVKLLPERKSYYTHEEILNCYKFFLQDAVKSFLTFVEQKMNEGTYDKSTLFEQLKEYEPFVVNQQIAKTIKEYLLNRFRSFKHKTDTEAEFKIARNTMGYKYYELQKAYKA